MTNHGDVNKSLQVKYTERVPETRDVRGVAY